MPKHYQKCFPEQFKALTCHLVKLNLPLQWKQKKIIYLSAEVTFSRQLFVLSFHLFCNHFPIDCLLQQLLKCVIAHFFSWKFIFHSLYLSAFVVIVTSVNIDEYNTCVYNHMYVYYVYMYISNIYFYVQYIHIYNIIIYRYKYTI